MEASYSQDFKKKHTFSEHHPVLKNSDEFSYPVRALLLMIHGTEYLRFFVFFQKIVSPISQCTLTFLANTLNLQ